MGHDFITDVRQEEYNSIKHGVRARSSGFSMAFGINREPDRPAPPEEMESLGGSEFGSMFFRWRRVDGRSRRQVTVRRHHVNWVPENLYHGLILVANSIQNVVGSLKLHAGFNSKDVQWRFPHDLASFDLPWALTTGVTEHSWGLDFDQAEVLDLSADEILSVYQAAPADESTSDGASA